MSDPNPYSTPGARVEDRPEPVDRRFRWKAVLVGAATDIAASTMTGIALVVIAALLTGPGEGGAEESVARLSESWTFLMISMILGGACTVLGGYIAGRIARHSFLKHAFAAGALSLVIGIALFRGDDGPYAGLLAFLGYGLHLPLALLGGWLASRRYARS
ncbi:MAG TPA: hypothetical protein VEV20_10095 [Burkholderiales bacterium]|nr:hypothetical protein [Burkholderiales bacterium]